MRKFLLFNTDSPRIRNFQFSVALLVTALLVSLPVTYGQSNSAAGNGPATLQLHFRRGNTSLRR